MISKQPIERGSYLIDVNVINDIVDELDTLFGVRHSPLKGTRVDYGPKINVLKEAK